MRGHGDAEAEARAELAARWNATSLAGAADLERWRIDPTTPPAGWHLPVPSAWLVEVLAHSGYGYSRRRRTG